MKSGGGVADRAVARRWAEAFVGALEPAGRRDSGLEELKGIAQLYSDSKELRRFLSSPEIGEEQKRRLLGRLWGDSVGPETMGLLQLLLKRDRVDHLPDIQQEAVRVSEERIGLVRGIVATAHPISSAETQRLAGAIGGLLGKKVLLERRVEPGLIGGARIRVGTQLVDGTVRGSLNRIREQLRQAEVA